MLKKEYVLKGINIDMFKFINIYYLYSFDKFIFGD